MPTRVVCAMLGTDSLGRFQGLLEWLFSPPHTYASVTEVHTLCTAKVGGQVTTPGRLWRLAGGSRVVEGGRGWWREEGGTARREEGERMIVELTPQLTGHVRSRGLMAHVFLCQQSWS
eukprot:976909-Rhodomonas_salina.1